MRRTRRGRGQFLLRLNSEKVHHLLKNMITSLLKVLRSRVPEI